MTPAEKGDEQQIDHIALSDDDFGDRLAHAGHRLCCTLHRPSQSNVNRSFPPDRLRGVRLGVAQGGLHRGVHRIDPLGESPPSGIVEHRDGVRHKPVGRLFEGPFHGSDRSRPRTRDARRGCIRPPGPGGGSGTAGGEDA